MNKRDFFKFLALSPLVVPAAAIAKAHEGDEPTQEAVKIVLYGSKKREWPAMSLSHNTIGGTFSMQEQDTTKSAALSVGNDGRLWVKTNNGEWKRVVTE